MRALRSLLGLARGLGRRFLVCDEMLPNPVMGAGYPRADRMVRTLAQTGYPITLAPVFHEPSNWASGRPNNDFPSHVETASPCHQGWKGIELLLRQRPRCFTDLIISRPTVMAELRPLLDQESKLISCMDITYDAEAIFANREILEEELAGRFLSYADKRLRISAELKMCRGVQRVIAVSNEEASLFRAHGYKTFVVGHAVKPFDHEEGCPSWEERSDFLFVGAIHGDGGPNFDSVMWFLEKVWPDLAHRFPVSRFVVAGLNHSKLLTEEPLPERVVVTKRLDDLSVVYNRARVFVAPTRFAAGIPLKVIEAACYGVPVVATSLLARQLSWRPNSEIRCADTPAAFTDACSKIFENRTQWERYQKLAARRVNRDYCQATFSEQLFTALNLRIGAHCGGVGTLTK